MKDVDPKQATWLKELLSLGLSVVGGLLMAYMMGSIIDPNREDRKRNKKYADQINRRLKKKLVLNQMELLLADTVVNPDDIDVSPDAIYGIDEIYDDLLNKAVKPLRWEGVFNTTLWRQTRGVLLYGPPGTGKTMLAKALAKSCNCFFMSVSLASIQSKWYGDAQKLVRAIFSLAEKLQPCIVFVDEVDAFLTTRGGPSEHEASLSVKTEFMQHWEGMATRKNSRILVMGTTNRRSALDPAVLRRFTVQYEIPLPSEKQRERIIRGYLEKHMRETAMGEKVYETDLLSKTKPVINGLTSLQWLAKHTEGFSGSHLLEVCAQAAKQPIIDAIKAQDATRGEESNEPGGLRCRACKFEDFQTALNAIRPIVPQTGEARFQQPTIEELAMAALLRQIGEQNGRNGNHNNGNNGRNGQNH